MDLFQVLTTANAVLLLCAISIFYTVALVIWRLFLCPVRNFPGSLWAKSSFSCEFWYEWLGRSGKFYEHIHEMHAKHGPIIRVTPEEIHIEDPLFYHQLFVPANVRRTNAYLRYAQGTGFDDVFALVGTHEGHKIIRDPVERLYSRVATHEPSVRRCARKFCDRLNQHKEVQEPMNLSNAVLSLALDVATTTTFEHPSTYLEDPKFNEGLFKIQKSGLQHVPLFSYLPVLARMLTTPLIQFLSSQIPELNEWEQKTRRQTFRGDLQVLSSKLQGRQNTVWKRSEFAGRVGQLIQQNGIFHVSHSIETVITHLSMNYDQRQRLQKELAEFWKERLGEEATWSELRKLPYLTACIYEGLRLGAGSLKRSPRIFPDDDIQYGEWIIPRGTPISMTTYYMHMDPSVFQQPESFSPERWLCVPQESLMHAYLVPFGKGGRACGGENVAWMQMYHALSQLYQPDGTILELFESDASDVQLAHGYVFPQPRLESPGVRVRVHSPSQAS